MDYCIKTDISMKRDKNKVARYKKAIDRCCNPECGMTGRIEVHHVVPLSRGGVDDYINFISLCYDCHRHSKVHGQYDHKQEQLFTWKFMAEILDIGICSDDVSSDEFTVALRACIKARRQML